MPFGCISCKNMPSSPLSLLRSPTTLNPKLVPSGLYNWKKKTDSVTSISGVTWDTILSLIFHTKTEQALRKLTEFRESSSLSRTNKNHNLPVL